MYGTSDKSEGSWKEALDITEFLSSERYFLSGDHSFPSLSLPPPSPKPHPNIKDLPSPPPPPPLLPPPAPLSGGWAFNKIGRQNTKKRQTGVCMVQSKCAKDVGRTGMKKFFSFSFSCKPEMNKKRFMNSCLCYCDGNGVCDSNHHLHGSFMQVKTTYLDWWDWTKPKPGKKTKLKFFFFLGTRRSSMFCFVLLF